MKARQSMPQQDHGLFCLVAAHLLRNSHKYFKQDKPSEMQVHILEEKTVTESIKQKVIEDFKDTNKKLHVIGDLKDKNRVSEQQQLVQELKEQYPTFRQISATSGVPLKTVHSWCSLPKKTEHKAMELANKRRQEFEQFLIQDSISFEHPSKKLSGKRFLRDTLEVTRQKYLQQPQYHKFGVISMSSMKNYRPGYILLCGQTPLDQCLCDKCENCEQLLKTLHAIGMQNIPSNRYSAVNSIMF